MRILVVTPWYPTQDAPDSGVFVAREAEALAAEHDVRVLHLDWNGPRDRAQREGGASVRRLWLRRARPGDYVRARRAVRRAAEWADVVHTHALPGLVPWLVGRPSGKPWVHSEHWSTLSSPETRGRAERLALRVLAPLLRRPAVVVAESSRLAQAIRRTRSGPTAIVPCIVPSVAVTDPPREMRLVGIGGLNDRKDPILAVDAVAALRDRGHDVHLTWVGGGPLRDAALSRAAQLGITQHVTLTGTLPSESVSQQLHAASALLLPTRGDNFCVAAAEALVHGRPIVSGAATGAVDYAPPQLSKFVVPRDAGAYADAVEEVLAAAAEIPASRIAAMVADRFTPAAVSAALGDIYRAVIGR